MMSFSKIEIVKTRDNVDLNVRVTIPQNPISTVIIHHGYGGSSDSPVIKRLSAVFEKSAYNVIVPNTRNSLNVSGGDVQNFTFSGHAQDLQDVVQWAQEQSWFTQGHLNLVGYSLGGFSAIKATDMGIDVQRLFLIAPILSGEFFEQGFMASFSRMMEIWKDRGALEFMNDQGTRFDALYVCWEEWKKATAVPEQSIYSGDVQILTAGRDGLIQPKHLTALKSGFVRASNVASETISGEDHFFSKVPNAIESWVAHIIK